MSISSRVASFLIFALLVITFTWTAPTLGAELSDTVVLVATPRLFASRTHTPKLSMPGGAPVLFQVHVGEVE